MSIASAVTAYEKELQIIGGCGDGYCLVTGKAKGMHTNGGCHCWQDKYKAQLAMRAAHSFLRAIKLELEENK